LHFESNKDLIQNNYVKKKVPKSIRQKSSFPMSYYFELRHCYSKRANCQCNNESTECIQNTQQLLHSTLSEPQPLHNFLAGFLCGYICSNYSTELFEKYLCHWEEHYSIEKHACGELDRQRSGQLFL
jgi:hypothetical protein